MKKGFVPRVLVGAVVVAFTLLTVINCKRGDSDPNQTNTSETEKLTAQYIGRESCKECHEKALPGIGPRHGHG